MNIHTVTHKGKTQYWLIITGIDVTQLNSLGWQPRNANNIIQSPAMNVLFNENNDIVVNYSCREINEIKLLGKEVHFNPWNSCELEEIIRKVLDFYRWRQRSNGGDR